MRDKRLWIPLGLLLIVQGYSIWLNHWFNKNLADSIETTYQRMVRDEVPPNLRSNVISALENNRFYISSYVRSVDNMHLMLDFILLTCIISFIRSRRAKATGEVPINEIENRA